MDDDATDQSWLCEAGHFHKGGRRCRATGQQPPRSCPCSQCQRSEGEEAHGLPDAFYEALESCADWAPCVYCGEEDCERSCTGAVLAEADAGEEEAGAGGPQ
jgi:hypothetical protein